MVKTYNPGRRRLKDFSKEELIAELKKRNKPKRVKRPKCKLSRDGRRSLAQLCQDYQSFVLSSKYSDDNDYALLF